MIRLPVRLAMSYVIRLCGDKDTPGGWSVVECRDVDEARRIMREWPKAEMPAWRNPNAPWNREKKS